jgi:hypothetical protein
MSQLAVDLSSTATLGCVGLQAADAVSIQLRLKKAHSEESLCYLSSRHGTSFAFDLGAVHDAARVGVEGIAAVHRAAVVP